MRVQGLRWSLGRLGSGLKRCGGGPICRFDVSPGDYSNDERDEAQTNDELAEADANDETLEEPDDEEAQQPEAMLKPTAAVPRVDGRVCVIRS